jgi:hypothetical protein
MTQGCYLLQVNYKRLAFVCSSIGEEFITWTCFARTARLKESRIANKIFMPSIGFLFGPPAITAKLSYGYF